MTPVLTERHQQVDPGSQNRAWNDTTNLVITGKALMQIHGDWMKGEWRNAGKVAGKDFGKGALGLLGRTGPYQAESVRNPVDMRVHADRGNAESEAED